VNAPAKHSDKERLLWERELLGLYLSAHPLDKYDDYFAEQTVGSATIKPEHDNRKVIVGGVINAARTIVTKSGSKMAFIRLEDKQGELEVIVFPNLYEEKRDILSQDSVIKVDGRISSTDREGNSLGEAKVIAETIELITDSELDGYEKTGQKMATPKPASKRRTVVKSSRVAAADAPREPVVYTPIELKKLYVHVKDPDDHQRLRELKTMLNQFPGESEIILVLGQDKKNAIRLPFSADPCDSLTSSISELFGADCVAIK
jgi:DNA polymerase-3 subunit alpha